MMALMQMLAMRRVPSAASGRLSSATPAELRSGPPFTETVASA